MIVGVTGFLSGGHSIQDPDSDQAVFMFEDDLGMAPSWSRAIAAWVNTDPRVRMLLSRSGRIHWANDAAYRMLRKGGGGFRATNDVLIAENEATSGILGRLLGDAPMDAALYGITPPDADRQRRWNSRARRKPVRAAGWRDR